MFWAILPVLLGLLAFPKETLAAAQDGALLWWTRVFPALVPYLIVTGLAARTRPQPLRIGKLHPLATSAFLLGTLGGYPVGARLLGDAQASGLLSAREAQRFSYAASLPSPAFLISVTAIGLFENARTALPLCGAVYLTAIGAFLLFSRAEAAFLPPPAAPRPSVASALTDAIGDGMNAILRIGGCIVLCRVIAALLVCLRLPLLLCRVLPVSEQIAEAVFNGILEMTSGCTLASALPLPLSLRLSLCTFFLLFGGASVLLQMNSFLPFPSLWRCLIVRALMAFFGALLCFFLCALLLPDTAVETMAPARMALRRTEQLLSLLVPCGMGLLTALYFVVLLKPASNRAEASDKPARK